MKYFDTPAFAHDLRIVLKSRKVAQLELSVQASVSAATVSRLFKRHSTPTPDHLACLLSWSGLSFDDYVLRNGVDPTKGPSSVAKTLSESFSSTQTPFSREKTTREQSGDEND